LRGECIGPPSAGDVLTGRPFIDGEPAPAVQHQRVLAAEAHAKRRWAVPSGAPCGRPGRTRSGRAACFPHVGPEESPLARHTREGMRAPLGERDAGPRRQVLHGARHQDLAGAGHPHDTPPDVSGDADEALAVGLDLAGMHSRPHMGPSVFTGALNLHAAATAWVARQNITRNASPWVPTSQPSEAVNAARSRVWWVASTTRYCSHRWRVRAVLSSMSVWSTVRVPVGRFEISWRPSMRLPMPETSGRRHDIATDDSRSPDSARAIFPHHELGELPLRPYGRLARRARGPTTAALL